MAMQHSGVVVLKVLLIVLLSSDGSAQRRVRLRRPPTVNYGRIMSMIRNVLATERKSVQTEFDAKLNETKHQLDEALLEIKILKVEREELRSTKEILGRDMEQLAASVGAAVDSFESSNSDLKGQVYSLQAANDELNATLRRMEEESRAEISSLELSNSELKDFVTSLQAANAEIDEDIQALKEDQRQGLETLELENSDLREQVSLLQENQDEMNNTLVTLKEDQGNRLETLELASADLREQISSLRTEQDEMNITLLTLDEDLKRVPDIIIKESSNAGMNGNSFEPHEETLPVANDSIDLGLTPGLVEHVEEYVEQPSYFALAMQEVNQIISDTKHELAEAIYPPCDFVYEGNCYFSEVHYYKKTDYADAETICTSRHATVAYPLNKEHFNQLLYNTRAKMPDGLTYVYVWTGLKQNPETGEVTTPDLEAAPYLKWYSGQPSKRNDETRIYLYVTKDARDGRQGMFDDYDGYEFHGAICQYGFPPLNDQELAAKRADMDWYKIRNGGQVYSYKLFLKTVAYKTAKQECASLGAGLASAGMRIPAVRSEVITQVVRHGGEDTWLGLDDFQTPGQWTWNDGVEATDANTNWYQNEASVTDTLCGVIRQGSVYKFKVDSGACWLEHFYLCEKTA